jgi:hypothetical protein
VLLVVAALLVLVGVTLLRRLHRPTLSPRSAETEVTSEAGNPRERSAAPQVEEAQTSDAQPTEGAFEPALPRSGPVARRASAPAPPPPLPAGSAPAQQLIAGLAQLQLSDTGLTPQQAQVVNESLQQLIAQGAAAAPAISQFLQRNEDLAFVAPGTRQFSGPASLRLGLIDALAQIGGDEALAVSRQVLQTTADPLEIARLTRNLEAQAPGRYRQEVLGAAREALAQAAQGQLAGRDVAPLFQVLQTYGDASVVGDLSASVPRWNYYSIVALAGLPDGQGIPSLIQLTQSVGSGGVGSTSFPLQMLAQVAPQHPEAQAALLEQARANQIPEAAWVGIATALAGDQIQLGTHFLEPTIGQPRGPGLKTYHIVAGNQNYFSTGGPLIWTDADLAARQALIDQLLAVNSTPAAVQALQRARNNLTPPPKP